MGRDGVLFDDTGEGGTSIGIDMEEDGDVGVIRAVDTSGENFCQNPTCLLL